LAAPAAQARAPRRRILPLVPALTVLALLGPVAAGLLGALGPAFGWLPAIGADEPGLAAFRDLFAWPGFGDAARLSLVTGLASTLLSLGVVTLVLASLHGTRAFGAVRRLLSPLLAVPHAAAAFGIAFLIAPSGWISRALSPWATGWERPPDLLIVQDPAGLALIAGLVAKEAPFLLLMALAALGQIRPERELLAARSLGYGREAAWLKAVFPRVYGQIRLPVYVVLAFSMSVVDVAMILGPNTPPTLSVQVVRWMGDPDLAARLRASAGALVQAGLVIGALGLWRLGEIAARRIGLRWIARGGRGRFLEALRPFALAAGLLSGAAVFAGIAGLAVWSVAALWPFPEALPEALTWRSWARHGPGLAETALRTLGIAAAATLIALVLTVGCLEAEHRHGLRLTTRGAWVLYMPLLIPQVAFLPGLQILMVAGGLTGGLAAVIAAHVVFVLPYVFLSLGDPFRAWDPRLATTAAALGARPDRVLWAVRMPMLLAPVLTAAAVGFAVSAGQYLPTLLAGGGRVATLTTEAVALAAGGDRRAIGIHGLAQTAAALGPFLAALLLPRLVWADRRGLRDGA
jgi:putative thiamine transport system permease protein